MVEIRKGNLSTRYGFIHLVRMCGYQGVRNVNFSEHFANVLNKWSLLDLVLKV